jgi:hypothetical protein
MQTSATAHLREAGGIFGSDAPYGGGSCWCQQVVTLREFWLGLVRAGQNAGPKEHRSRGKLVRVDSLK